VRALAGPEVGRPFASTAFVASSSIRSTSQGRGPRFSPAERIGTAEPNPGGSGLQVFGSDHYALVAVLDR
jgi:hypothetical protein